MLIEPGATVLFQGDSITDAGRNREWGPDMGKGYANMTAGRLGALYPRLGLSCVNRGIGGNRTKDLLARWQTDALDLKPNWISILIGINDMWRRYDKDDPTPLDAFEANYRAILEQSQAAGAKLILLEPFLIPTEAKYEDWRREDLNEKIRVTRALAREFQTLFVPLDGLFQQACAHQAPAYWATDGIHPTPAGHALIAEAWLQAVSH